MSDLIYNEHKYLLEKNYYEYDEERTCYKAFNKNLTSKYGFQYEVGKVYEIDKNELQLGKCGFHFCECALDVDYWYPPNKDTTYAVIEVLGDAICNNIDSNAVTNKIKIHRQITRKELIKEYKISMKDFN